MVTQLLFAGVAADAGRTTPTWQRVVRADQVRQQTYFTGPFALRLNHNYLVSASSMQSDKYENYNCANANKPNKSVIEKRRARWVRA